MIINLMVFIVTGGLAGWLAATLVKGRGFGPVGNIILGVVGSLLGGFLFDFFGIQPGGIPGYLMAAIVGSVSLLVIVGLIKTRN